MNKISTSLEQSKKLIELGISFNTADMFYADLLVGDNHKYNLHLLESYGFKTFGETKLKISNHLCFIPAWSLTALLKLMPTDDKKDEYYVTTESHSDYHTVNYRNCWDGCIHSAYSEESLLDAAFEMVCWLLENKKL